MKKNTIIGAVVIVGIVSAGSGFFGGIKYTDYQRSKNRTTGMRQFQGMGNGDQMQNRTLGGRPVTGEVINKDETSITVKTQDGGSKIIILSKTTVYSKTEEATLNDVSVGEKVGIFGTENSDKTMTAETVQLNPQFKMSTVSNQPTPIK